LNTIYNSQIKKIIKNSSGLFKIGGFFLNLDCKKYKKAKKKL